MAIVKDIDHEAGDLTEYNSTVTDSGDLSAHADAALAGTNYGLKCVIDDTTAIYGNITLSAFATNFRVRFYIDPNTLTMAQFEKFTTFSVFLSGAPWNLLTVELSQLAAGGGDYRLTCTPYNDAGGLSSDLEAITDAPHYVEVSIVRASSAVAGDGSAQWWIDGVSKGTWASVDNYDAFGLVNLARLGATVGLDAGTSGTFFLDQLVINDDGGAIGAYTPPAGGLSGSGAGSLASAGASARVLNLNRSQSGVL